MTHPTDHPTDQSAASTAQRSSSDVVAVREPGSTDPILLEPGDRVRLVIEGTIEDLREGVLGGLYPAIRTDRGDLYEPNYPALIAARIERLRPAPIATNP